MEDSDDDTIKKIRSDERFVDININSPTPTNPEDNAFTPLNNNSNNKKSKRRFFRYFCWCAKWH